ncbi:MAG: SPOR domain-containing protein [Polyangiaceae bacterium]
MTVAFVALGGACVLFAGLALAGRHSTAKATPSDPLGELVAQRNGNSKNAADARAKMSELSAKDVTFPGILSDSDRPTTALAAVKGGNPRAAALLAVEGSDPSAGLPAAPPPSDRLPVVPLPAQNVLQASPVVTRPRDTLTRVANESAQVNEPPAPSSAAGHEGGYSLQVSSFRAQGEAQTFADQLRARGHKAYVVEAHVPERGTWYRVRVGPFTSQQAASAYRAGFEAKEHVVPFIVTPATKHDRT